MIKWTWNLRRFSDQSFLGRLEKITDRNLTPVINGAGSATFNIQLTDDMAYLIDNLSTYVQIKANDVVVWEGRVWDTKEDAASNKMQVSCMGWFEDLQKRFTNDELVFTNATFGYVCWSLLAHTSSTEGTLGYSVGLSQNAGSTILPRYTVARDANIAQEIQKLCQVENGIDFYFDYTERMFKFVADIGVDRPDIHFGYERGPFNLNNATRTKQGTRVVNRMKVLNRHNSFITSSNTASITARGVFKEIMTLNGLRDEPPGAEVFAMNAFGAAETIVRGNPISVYEISVMRPEDDDLSNVVIPLPYERFFLGDKLRLSVDRGVFQLTNQMVKCYGLSMSIDNEDRTILNSLVLAPS